MANQNAMTDEAKQNMVWLFQQTDFSLTNILGLVQRLHALKVKNLATPESLRAIKRLYQTTTNSFSFIQSNRGRPVAMRLVRDIFQTLDGKDRSSMASPGMSYPLVIKLLSYTRLLEEWNKSFAVLSKLMSIVSWVSSTP